MKISGGVRAPPAPPPATGLVLRWQMMPMEAKFQSYVAFVARLRLQIPPDHATDMTFRAIRLRTSVTQNLFTRETCINSKICFFGNS